MLFLIGLVNLLVQESFQQVPAKFLKILSEKVAQISTPYVERIFKGYSSHVTQWEQKYH